MGQEDFGIKYCRPTTTREVLDQQTMKIWRQKLIVNWIVVGCCESQKKPVNDNKEAYHNSNKPTTKLQQVP